MASIAEYYASLKLDTSKALGAIQGFERKIDSVGKKLEDVGGSLTKKVTLPIIGGFVAAIKGAGDLEAGMIGVQKTTGLANGEITNLKKSFLSFGGENAVSVGSLVETAKVAGQLGLESAAEIEKFTKTFAKLEIASDRTVQGELGATAFAKFIDLSGESIDAAEGIASSITALGNTSKTNEGRILSTSQQIVKSTARFGLGAANILGIATALDEVGVEAEVSGSTLQKFYNELDIATKSGSENQSLFAKTTGLSVDEIKKLQKTDPSKILLKFVDGLNKINKDGGDTASLLKDLRLGEIRTSGALQALAANSDKVANKMRLANEALIANTALNDEAKAANRGFNASMTRMGNSFLALGDAIGESGLLDAITGIIGKTTSFILQVSQGNPELLKFGLIVAGIAASIGPAIFIFGKLARGIGLVTTALRFLTFTPLGLAITGISLAIYGLIKLFDVDFVGVLENVREWLKEVIPKAIDYIKTKLFDFGKKAFSVFKKVAGFFGFSDVVPSIEGQNNINTTTTRPTNIDGYVARTAPINTAVSNANRTTTVNQEFNITGQNATEIAHRTADVMDATLQVAQ